MTLLVGSVKLIVIFEPGSPLPAADPVDGGTMLPPSASAPLAPIDFSEMPAVPPAGAIFVVNEFTLSVVSPPMPAAPPDTLPVQVVTPPPLMHCARTGTGVRWTVKRPSQVDATAIENPGTTAAFWDSRAARRAPIAASATPRADTLTPPRHRRRPTSDIPAVQPSLVTRSPTARTSVVRRALRLLPRSTRCRFIVAPRQWCVSDDPPISSIAAKAPSSHTMGAPSIVVLAEGAVRIGQRCSQANDRGMLLPRHT